MIELYGMGSPNVIKVMVMLDEAGLAYRMTYVDVFKQEQFDPEFARISPTRKVPVIVDDDGPGGEPISVFESGAILIYLAEKVGRFLPSDPRARVQVFEWLMVQVSLMGPMGGQAVHFSHFAPGENAYAKERYSSQCANVHRLLDERLSERPWLGGEEISIADFATFPWLHQAIRFFPWLRDADGAKLRARHPHLARWYEALWARPGVQRAMARLDEGRGLKSLDAATPETLDRFTLRGEFSAIPDDMKGVEVGYDR